MSMTQGEIEQHAERIADVHLETIEYSDIYEDEELEDASEEDWQAIHRHIQTRLTTVRDDLYDILVAPNIS
jgi:hypothetical protein